MYIVQSNVHKININNKIFMNLNFPIVKTSYFENFSIFL